MRRCGRQAAASGLAPFAPSCAAAEPRESPARQTGNPDKVGSLQRNGVRCLRKLRSHHVHAGSRPPVSAREHDSPLFGNEPLRDRNRLVRRPCALSAVRARKSDPEKSRLSVASPAGPGSPACRITAALPNFLTIVS